ncbi:hypothetical protein FKW77_003381 [Venturia effusa]|uniref:Phosphatidylglycerol/phosphatidylinositol transfer protein n=1 Tax=Venturia effusa TaxID=50376 RepID=A0A517LPU9_9PEZI|nr:hypothetical protein FKW77_003381 [Venturia effusa]
MRFSSALLFTAITSAIALPTEVEEREVNKVHPLTYKSCGSTSDVLHVDSITLDHNPPIHGSNTIKVSGNLREAVTEGTKIAIRVKAGFLTVYHKELDLCDLAKSKMGMSCPIPAGQLDIKKEFEIPKRIPHANVKVALSGKLPNGKRLTCYNMDVGV